MMITRTHLLGLLTLTASLTLGPAPAEAQLSTRPLPQRKPPLRKIRLLDLAAHRIEFQVLRRTSRFAGRVRISGVVRNVGTVTFQSGARQATAYLFEGRRVVARQELRRLTPGQEVRLSITRSWSQTNEFPPSYKLLISWDPDIHMDGNPSNDDERRNNDSKVVTGHSMQRTWRLLLQLEAQRRRLRLPRRR